MSTQLKPTTFEALRYGYFDRTFGNMLKAIRGGADPIAVMTLAFCCVGALSEIDWSLNNQLQLQTNGELMRGASGHGDKEMYTGWLARWVKVSGINANCDPARVYGVRCALVHTGGGSEALCKTGIKDWIITANAPGEQYQAIGHDVYRFSIDMPLFLAEIMHAADRFLNERKADLNGAGDALKCRVGGIAGLSTTTDGKISGRLIRNPDKSLTWFDERLTVTPLQVPVADMAGKIRDFYYEAVEAGLVLEQ